MIDEKQLEIQSVAHETVWIGDAAVDLEATDIAQWYQTGEGYVLKPKERASVIRWRPLRHRELMQVIVAIGKSEEGDGALTGGMLAAGPESCRYGLLKVEGLNLARQRKYGVLGLTDAAIEMLDGLVIDNELPEVPGVPRQFRLVDWLGGLISRESFRDRR